MSLKASNKVDTNRYEVEIVIDGKTFRDAIQTVFKRDARKINVPGFRKGKAPLGIIEKYYGESVFYEDALNLLYSDAIDEAAEEVPVAGDDDKASLEIEQVLLQYVQSNDVQVIGRLVQNQQIRLFHQNREQVESSSLPSGKLRNFSRKHIVRKKELA